MINISISICSVKCHILFREMSYTHFTDHILSSLSYYHYLIIIITRSTATVHSSWLDQIQLPSRLLEVQQQRVICDIHI